jgi:CysZ protein
MSRTLDNSPLTAAYLMRGLRLLAEPGLRHLVWIPLLINLALYAAALFTGVHYFSAFVNFLLPAWLDFLRWLLWPLFGLSFILIIYFSFTMVANLVGSPFYGWLAEKTMARGQGAVAPHSEQPWSRALAGGVITELKRLGYFVSRAVPLLILFAIPGLNLVAPFVWLAFNAWFLAMEYLAYPLELQGIEFDEQRQIAKRMRLGLFGFGGAAMLGLAVPGLNLLIPPAAVVGATLYASERRLGSAASTGSASR